MATMESISTQQQQVSLLVRFRGKKVVIDNLGSFQEFKETLTPKPPLSTSVITTLSSVIKERLQQQQMISIFDEQILSEFDIQYFAHDFMEYVDFVAGDPSSFLLRLQKDDLRARILIIERPATSSTPSPSTGVCSEEESFVLTVLSKGVKALYEQDPAAEKYAQQGIVLGRLAFDVYRRFFVSSSDQTLQQMLQREESKLAAITPSKAATSYGVGMTVKSTPLSSSSPPSTSVAKTASPRGDSPSIVSQLPRPKKAIKRRDIPAEAPASTSPVPLHVKAQSVPTLPTSSPPSTPPTTASTAPPAAGSPLVSTAPTPVSPTPTTVSSALAPTSTPTLVSAPLAPAPAVLLAPVPLPASASTPVAPPSPEQTQPRLPVSSSEPALPRPPPGQPGHMYNVRISASTSVLPETDRKDIHPPTHSSLASSAPSTAALEEEIPPPPPPQDDVLPPPPPPPELPRNNSAKFGVSAVAPEAGAQRKAFAPEKQLIRTFTTPIQFAGQEEPKRGRPLPTPNLNPGAGGGKSTPASGSKLSFDAIIAQKQQSSGELQPVGAGSGGAADTPAGLSTRERVIAEIIQTERAYIENVKTLIELLKSLKERLQQSHGLRQTKLDTIFNDAKLILPCNETLLADLERMPKEDTSSTLGKTFLRMAPFLKLYTVYVTNSKEAFELIANYRQNDPQFERYLKALEGRRTPPMEINSFLIQPIQRIPRYKLLFESLLKATEPDHPDYKNLSAALAAVSETALHINEAQRKMEQTAKLMQIQSQILDFNNIVEPHRSYIREGKLEIQNPDEVGDTFYCFLFSDLLVYTTPSGNMYQFRGMIRLKAALPANLVENNERGWKHPFALRISGTSGAKAKWVHEFNAANEAEKTSWLNDLKKLIRELNPEILNPKFKEEASEDDPFNNCSKEGYLLMDAGLFWGWKKRYLVLKSTSLYIFDAHTDAQPKVVIDIGEGGWELGQDPKKKKTLRLAHPATNRTHCWMSEDEDEVLEWYQKLLVTVRIAGSHKFSRKSLPPGDAGGTNDKRNDRKSSYGGFFNRS